MGSLILMYHDIFLKSPAPFIPRSSNIYHISEQTFIEHLNQIKKSKVHVVRLTNLLTSKDSISLTFDDGWIGAFNIGLPLIKEFGFKCTFFITKSFVGRRGFVNEKRIVMASEAGMEIGVHGTTHRMLSNCSNDEIIWEFKNCREYLESLTGQNIISASMPGGDWNKNIASCAKKAGFKNLCVSTPGINYTYTNSFKLQRIAITDKTSNRDISRYCDKNISKELIKSGFFNLPKKILGMKKYSNLRRRILGENKDSNSEIFKP
tara:strand:+ start:620 stop:1408 length:789 start_codon:yes stop_codon:yes gene_type:complete